MYMTLSQFGYYIESNGKTELFRNRRVLTNKNEARSKLRELLTDKWLWLVIPNNCADFVEEVIGAGENDFGLISNCPKQLSIKVQQEARRRKMILTRRGYRMPR